jgi:hypothetical protein
MYIKYTCNIFFLFGLFIQFIIAILESITLLKYNLFNDDDKGIEYFILMTAILNFLCFNITLCQLEKINSNTRLFIVILKCIAVLFITALIYYLILISFIELQKEIIIISCLWLSLINIIIYCICIVCLFLNKHINNNKILLPIL